MLDKIKEFAKTKTGIAIALALAFAVAVLTQWTGPLELADELLDEDKEHVVEVGEETGCVCEDVEDEE